MNFTNAFMLFLFVTKNLVTNDTNPNMNRSIDLYLSNAFVKFKEDCEESQILILKNINFPKSVSSEKNIIKLIKNKQEKQNVEFVSLSMTQLKLELLEFVIIYILNMGDLEVLNHVKACLNIYLIKIKDSKSALLSMKVETLKEYVDIFKNASRMLQNLRDDDKNTFLEVLSNFITYLLDLYCDNIEDDITLIDTCVLTLKLIEEKLLNDQIRFENVTKKILSSLKYETLIQQKTKVDIMGKIVHSTGSCKVINKNILFRIINTETPSQDSTDCKTEKTSQNYPDCHPKIASQDKTSNVKNEPPLISVINVGCKMSNFINKFVKRTWSPKRFSFDYSNYNIAEFKFEIFDIIITLIINMDDIKKIKLVQSIAYHFITKIKEDFNNKLLPLVPKDDKHFNEVLMKASEIAPQNFEKLNLTKLLYNLQTTINYLKENPPHEDLRRRFDRICETFLNSIKCIKNKLNA